MRRYLPTANIDEKSDMTIPSMNITPTVIAMFIGATRLKSGNP